MSAAFASGAPTSIALCREDRLHALFAPIGGMPRLTLPVLVGSVALHLIIVATAIVTSRAPLALPEPQATTVEVVQEVPKPPDAAKPPPEAIKPPPPAPKPPPPLQKAEAPKVEAPKVRAPTPSTPQTEAKVEPPKPSMQAVAEEREALLKELAALRAQEAKIEARQAPADLAARPNLGMGPLPDSFQAVALPSSTEGTGEAMGYKEIVFSQLAKAKGLDERMGMPGTAGVRFEIDAAGSLVRVEVVHPSGVAALDREALDIVRRAAPFPAPPQGAQRSFTANVSFVAQGKP